MDNSVLVEVSRGGLIESRHRGAVAVVDADARAVLALGEVTAPIFPRSAIKAIQALALVETGAADRYKLAPEHLALACASHGGEPGHVAGVAAMLAAAGRDERALACGVHWPSHQPSALDLARAGETPGPLHNNCSGKHGGFICAACAMGVDPANYTQPDHPVQRAVKDALEDVTGTRLADEHRAVDGCSVPTWAVPLRNLAHGFARMATGRGLGPERAAAAKRLFAACAAHPWRVAGTGRFCTAIMDRFGSRVFVKTGAEGVFCGALPEQGIGIAIKIDDGASRASEAAMAALIARFLPMDAGEQAALSRLVRPTLRNWNGVGVGAITPAAALLAT